MKKIAFALLLALSLAPMGAMAQVRAVIRVGPPAPVVEHYGRAPHRGNVWIAGYYRWNAGRYVWVPGYWAAPPRPHAVWVPHRWVHRHGEWVLVGGRWR